MNPEPDFQELLASHLTRVPAPEFLWTRVAAALGRPEPQPKTRWESFRFPTRWVLALSLLAAVFFSLEWRRRAQNEALDLRGYIEGVQESPTASASTALYRVPDNFTSVARFGRPVSLAGYAVVEQRMTSVNGEPVQQMILRSGQTSVALFVAPTRLRLDAGRNTWVEDQLAGVKCKRLDCPRVRTVQFACATTATCVLICKACSEETLHMLLTALTQ